MAPLFAVADTVFTDDGSVEKVNWSDPYVKEEKLLDYEMGIGYTGGIFLTQAQILANKPSIFEDVGFFTCIDIISLFKPLLF